MISLLCLTYIQPLFFILDLSIFCEMTDELKKVIEVDLMIIGQRDFM